MLASLINISPNLGYPVLFGIVMVESMGIPVPGETAIVAASLAATRGSLSIELVIAVAAVAAIVGDNIGFEIGRRGGRAVLERPGRFARQRHQVLAVGTPFMERHGPKAVFLGRWFAGLRIWAAWLAGASDMRWRTFFVWNAAGGICWATSVGLAIYFGGQAVEQAIAQVGLYGGIGVAAILVVLLLVYRRRAHAHAPPADDEVQAPQVPPEAAAAPGDTRSQ